MVHWYFPKEAWWTPLDRPRSAVHLSMIRPGWWWRWWGTWVLVVMVMVVGVGNGYRVQVRVMGTRNRN